MSTVAPGTTPDPSQRYEVVPLDRLTPHPDNPRRGDVAALGDSLTSNGFYGALIVQASSGYILAGNHRWQALKARGATSAPVIWLDVDDDRARRVLLADNRLSDTAGWDDAGLLALLEDLATSADVLAGTGFDMDALDDLRAELDDVVTVTPAANGAHYAETPEEEDERVNALGHNGRKAAGLRELVVVLPLELHGEATARLAELRKAAPDASSGEVVLAALNAVDTSAMLSELSALRPAGTDVNPDAQDDGQHDGQGDEADTGADEAAA